MAKNEPTQPDTVSKAVANYLKTTAPRTWAPKDRPLGAASKNAT